MMKKITRDDELSRSADLTAQNVQRLAELFPEAVSEGRVDLDLLRQLLGDRLEGSGERFGLNWKGKGAARQLALRPSTGTLRPCREESVDWETTQNVFIEGDNLEVLKLLQKSYQGRVKLIYIDPPYNTGHDFVYPDDFRDGIANYLRMTNQADESGVRLTTNSETSGRFHSQWLSMMLPRLTLARGLLRADGLIFISIDDWEFADLRYLMDEVFGADHFVCAFVWKSRVSEDTRATTGASADHEYLVCYRVSEEGRLRGSDKDLGKFSNEDQDPRGPWRSGDLTGLAPKDKRPNLHYDLVDPATGINYGCPAMGWRYEPRTMEARIRDGRILWPSSPAGRPRHKLFLRDMKSAYKNTSSVIVESSTSEGTRELREIFGEVAFPFPKPVSLLRFVVEQATEPDSESIILDFFAGSGTLAEAVWVANRDGSDLRRWLLVQLPEAIEGGNYRTVAEVTKERLRRADRRLRTDPERGFTDLGFRVYKLDSTNLKTWDPQPENLARQIELAIEHIKPGRSEADLLTELLLKLGLELTVPVDTHTVAGHTVYAVGGGALLACLSPRIARADVEDLAEGLVALDQKGKPAVIFRDAAFEDDVAKANLSAILEQRGLHNLRSL